VLKRERVRTVGFGREHDWARVNEGRGIDPQWDTYRQGVQECGIGVRKDTRQSAPKGEPEGLAGRHRQASLPKAIICKLEEVTDIRKEGSQLVLGERRVLGPS
jgi:hypothetical protein